MGEVPWEKEAIKAKKLQGVVVEIVRAIPCDDGQFQPHQGHRGGGKVLGSPIAESERRPKRRAKWERLMEIVWRGKYNRKKKAKSDL